MKRLRYSYVFAILVIATIYVYTLLTYFWIMTAFIVASSLFSFVMFLIRTHVKNPIESAQHEQAPIDFYKPDTRTTYYTSNGKNTYYDRDITMPFFEETFKQANAS